MSSSAPITQSRRPADRPITGPKGGGRGPASEVAEPANGPANMQGKRKARAGPRPAEDLTRPHGQLPTPPDYALVPRLSPTETDAGESPKRLLNLATAVSTMTFRV